MYVSVVTILIGEAILLRSAAVAMEAGVFLLMADIFVTRYEEPVLRREFGAEYEMYTRRVGRWLPRIRSKAT